MIAQNSTNISITQNSAPSKKTDQNFSFEDIKFYPFEKNSEYGKFIELANDLNKLFGIYREFHIAKRSGSYYRDINIYSLPTEQQKEQYLAYLLALHLAGEIVIAPTTVKGTKYNPKEKKFFDFIVNASYFDVDIIFSTIQNKVLEFVEYIKQKYDINLLFGKSRSGATRLMFIYEPIELKKAHYLNKLIVEDILDFFEGFTDKDNKLLTRNGIKRTASNLEGKGVVVSLPCDFISNGTETINFNIKFDKNIPLENQYEDLLPVFQQLKNFLLKNKSDIKEIAEWATQEFECDAQQNKKVENKQIETKNTIQKENNTVKQNSNTDLIEFNSKILSERKHSIQGKIIGAKLFVFENVAKQYKKGNRNEIIRVLSAALYYSLRTTLDETKAILEPLLRTDEEEQSRLELIERTYKRAASGENLEYKKSFEELFGKNIYSLFSTIKKVQTSLAYVLLTAPANIRDSLLATMLCIVGEMIYKKQVYGKVFISQQALAERWHKSKSFINEALKLLEELNYIQCVEKSRTPHYAGGKGSEYELLFLSEKETNNIEDILTEKAKLKINLNELKEIIELVEEASKEIQLHYKKTKHLDRKHGINAFEEPDDKEVFAKNVETIEEYLLQLIKTVRRKYQKETLEFHEDDIFPF